MATTLTFGDYDAVNVYGAAPYMPNTTQKRFFHVGCENRRTVFGGYYMGTWQKTDFEGLWCDSCGLEFCKNDNYPEDWDEK